MMQRLKAMIFSLVIVGVGVGLFIFANMMGGEVRDVQDWPTTEGTLLKADTDRIRTGGEEKVVPKLSYEYSVEGKKYESTSLEPGRRYYDSRGEITRIVRPFEVGAKVTVHYNATNPSEAYLRAYVGGGIMAISGIAVAGLGVLSLVLSAVGFIKIGTPEQMQ